MNIKVIDNNGKQGEEIQLEDKVYNVEVNDHLIWEAIKNELANMRQGTHNTKTRQDVSGGGKKPYRQKGTGRARQGTIRSPLHRGGGIVFGPHPRDYSYSMPRRAKRNAYKSILSKKMKSGSIKIVNEFKVESGKTKEAYQKLSSIISDKRRVLLVYKDENDMLKRSLKNIPWVTYTSCYRLKAHELYYAKEIVMTKEAATQLNTFLLSGAKEGDNE